MTTGVVLLNFGEPPTADRDSVVDYLERIFFANADLEEADSETRPEGESGKSEREAERPASSEAEARERSRQLAERRAPALVEEYEEIGGSPLNEQAAGQAESLEYALRHAGYDVNAYVGMQFTEPFIADAVDAAIDDGVDRLVALPVYPLCGPSTTVNALEELQDAVQERDANLPVQELSGWHRHPDYARLRADTVADFATDRDLDLAADDTALVFSAHGTPVRYLEEGSRYDVYVEEYCSVQASLFGVEDYHLGYQNHENRDIPWTEPEVEDLVLGLDADRVVVEPISFLHEQSETLSELDDELRAEAEDAGLEFYRVPIPHDDERIVEVFSDLVEPFLAEFDPGYFQLRQCQCRNREGTMCLNAPR